MDVIVPPQSSAPASSRAQMAFRDECIDQFSGLAQLLGLPKSIGQIYGLLFASPQPLSFTDIVAQLGVSKGSVSQGIKALREVGAIRPVVAQGERREHFVPETELRKLVAGFLQGSIRPQLRSGLSKLDDFKAQHAVALTAEGEAGRLVLERLAKLQKWHRRAGSLLPFISRFLG